MAVVVICTLISLGVASVWVPKRMGQDYTVHFVPDEPVYMKGATVEIIGWRINEGSARRWKWAWEVGALPSFAHSGKYPAASPEREAAQDGWLVEWPLLFGIHALILLLGGGLLTVVVRRERRRKAAV
jgi:hypothetical protein